MGLVWRGGFMKHELFSRFTTARYSYRARSFRDINQHSWGILVDVKPIVYAEVDTQKATLVQLV